MPPLHTYEEAPKAFNVTVVPAHTVEEGDALVVIEGTGFTTTVAVAVFVQPFASVPITVYVCVAEGLNATPFTTPLLHAYETPPEPFNTTEVPAQIGVAGVAVALIDGNGFTTIVIVAVAVHPNASEPVTV